MIVGRLAPTPSGHLHLGNVLAFGAAWLSARSSRGRLLLRFEDVDTQRARPEIEASIREDLDWLGITWDAEVPPQRDRDYDPWLQVLRPHTYHCLCTRREIRASGGIYRGVCRERGHTEGAVRFRLPGEAVTVHDRKFGARTLIPAELGDPVLQRRDGAFAYPLAVVADDIADGVTEVVRGADLLEPSAVQIPLWRALEATPPTYLHVPLILGADGRKLSKSHGSSEVRAWRATGRTPSDVWRCVLPWLGASGHDHLHQAVGTFAPTEGPPGPIVMDDATSR